MTPRDAIERHFSLEGAFRYKGNVSPAVIASEALRALERAGFVVLHTHDDATPGRPQ